MWDDSDREPHISQEPRASDAPTQSRELRSRRPSAPTAVAQRKPARTSRRRGQPAEDTLSSRLAAEMRHVTDALPDGVVVVDNSGRIQLANRQSELMFGYETVDIVGQPVETLMPERFREAHPLHRLSYTQSPHMRPMGTGLRLFGRRKDGSEFPVEISLSPISFAGEPLTLAAIRDVTEQRLMEQRARQAVETRLDMLQVILDQLPTEVYLVLGRDARLVLANRQVPLVWGAEWPDGQPMREFLAESGARVFDMQGHELPFERLATIRALRSGESVHQHQEVIRRADGSRLSALVNAVSLPSYLFPILTGEGDIREAYGGATGDAPGTGQVANEHEPLALVVHQDVGALVEAERLKDEFVALAAHELRNPIASLLGYAQLLIQAAGPLQHSLPSAQRGHDGRGHSRRRQAGDETDVRLEAVNEILESSHRLATLTDELLDATRLQANRLELRLEPLELGALVRRVAKRAQITTRKHPITVTAPADPVLTYVDVQRIEQVLTNLISNAIKYSPDGGPVEVKLEVSQAEPSAEASPRADLISRRERTPYGDLKLSDSAEVGRISVSDHGMGIPADQQHRIFGRFSRAVNARERGISGTGLGLYLCRELIALHGGRIWFESVEGSGTTFHFELRQISVED